MPEDILNQDDIDSLLAEMGGGTKESSPAPKPAAPEASTAAADWGLTEEELAAEAEPEPKAKTVKPPATPPASEARAMPMESFSSGKPFEGSQRSLDFVLDIPLVLAVEVGRTRMTIGELLNLGSGSIVELQKLAGEPLEILVNGKLVARGEAVIINEKFGVRLTDVISKAERIESLR